MNKKGKFIVIYGANNLGKTTQVKLLQKTLEDKGIKVKLVKYPVYDLAPTGPKINAVLRKGLKMDEEKLQKLYVQNRRDFEPTLKSFLNQGFWVIAEDYVDTGIAWGLVRGVSLEKLERINKGLLPEDLSILIFGKRFKDGVEASHRNESDDQIWQTAQDKHLFLAAKYGWKKINANQTIEKVHKDILKNIEKNS